MKRAVRVLSIALALAMPSLAMAGRCEDLARPVVFNGDTAMEAIFCEYDRAHRGTLLPLSATAGWQIGKADYLATPHFATTYLEGGVRRGVLVVQRQSVFDGRVADSHATPAGISVYVFRHDGSRWVFEKGRRDVKEDGSNGIAPTPRLVRLGDHRMGLWFEGGAFAMGAGVTYVWVASLSDEDIPILGEFTTAENDGNHCGAPQDGFPRPCPGYESRTEFLRIDGDEGYVLRIRSTGTRRRQTGGYEGELISANSVTCHRLVGARYVKTQVPGCADRVALPEKQVFDPGQGEEREQRKATIPNKP